MARAAKRSLVKQRPGQANYYENFTVDGRRFRGCLGTDDKEQAELLARKKFGDALLGSATGRRPEIPLTQALGRYWLERGQHAATADEIKRYGLTMIAALGADTPLSKLTDGGLSAYVAGRRVRQVRHPATRKLQRLDRANGSINREIGHLRTVVLAAKRWGFMTPEVDWRRLRLDEPENVQTVLSVEAEAEFFEALRPDYHPLVLFALLTGVRLDNAIGLTWRQIDFDAQTITFRTKSRRPGGALHILPLTRSVAAVLSHERGNHPELVFTYVSSRNRHDPRRGVLQEKGKRYPFTHDGWRKAWDEARQAAGVPQLRFHDLRHTAGTRAFVAHRSLKAVQRMLGHADIASTLRYLASDVSDVRAAMEAVEAQAQARHKAVPSNRFSKRNQGA